MSTVDSNEHTDEAKTVLHAHGALQDVATEAPVYMHCPLSASAAATSFLQ